MSSGLLDRAEEELQRAERGGDFLDEFGRRRRARGNGKGDREEASADGLAGDSASSDWPEPQPLTIRMAPEPYPLDALPDTIRAAVEEVQGFTKAPVPLVASSALASLSMAAQAHIDVKRAERLSGPVSLFLLGIADSGERKTTCDGFFTSAIREYEAESRRARRA